jgi:selenocysteine lyase/cysteine desulfurase
MLLRDRYLLDPGVTYFNHGSIGTIPRVVQDARSAYLDLCETNPWLYMWGGAWEEPRELVRRKAADLLGCDAVELAFTHNTTEGFNTLAGGLALGPGDQVLFAYMYGEHGYVFRPFNTQGLNTVRISPNVYNIEDEIARFFELTAGMAN